MTNRLVFFGSCGHTTVEEVGDERWAEIAARNYSIESSDGSARTTYVYPLRFCICQDCFSDEDLGL